MKKLLILLLPILMMGCRDNLRTNDFDFLVFGVYNGFCIENCSSLYKLENGKLFRDNVNLILGFEDVTFDPEPLSEDKYDKAKVVKEEIPQKLLNEEETTFGCPGCVDQNIIMLVYKMDGEIKEFKIDTFEEDIPQYMRSYVSKLESIVFDLND